MTGPATREQISEALDLLLRHTRHAPPVHFGDSRERSSSIRASVHRLTTEELIRQFRINEYIARHVPVDWIPREKRRDLYDVGHEIRREFRDRPRP